MCHFLGSGNNVKGSFNHHKSILADVFPELDNFFLPHHTGRDDKNSGTDQKRIGWLRSCRPPCIQYSLFIMNVYVFWVHWGEGVCGLWVWTTWHIRQPKATGVCIRIGHPRVTLNMKVLFVNVNTVEIPTLNLFMTCIFFFFSRKRKNMK